MPEFDKGALQYVFPEELLRYFEIVESGIHTDKPTGEDSWKWSLKRRVPCLRVIQKKTTRAKASLINGFKTFHCEARLFS